MQRYLARTGVVSVMEMRRAIPVLLAGLVLLGGTAFAAPNDPGWPQQWNLAKIRADRAWATSKGSGAVIAIVDTGVDLGHEDFKGRLVQGHDVVGDDPDNPNDADAYPQDGNGHGTFMAGVAAAATGNGLGVASVAPSAKIMPIRVLGETGSGKPEDVARGIRWAVDHGADIINLSLAETSAGGISLPGDFFKNSTLDEAIRDAAAAGRFVAIASGNDFSSSGGKSSTAYDAKVSGVLVVGASTSGDKRAAYSNYGSGLDVLAPGGGSSSDPSEGAVCRANDPVLSTFWESSKSDSYGVGCGTSMAVAHVSGVAALLMARGYSAAGAADRIVATAKDLGASGWDSGTGHGRVDALAAVGAASSARPPAAPPQPVRKKAPKKKVAVAASPTPVPTVRGVKVSPTPSSAPTGLLLAVSENRDAPPFEARRGLVLIATALSLMVGVAHPLTRVLMRRP